MVTGGIIEGKLIEDFMRNAQLLLFLEHLFWHTQGMDFPSFINKRYGCSSFDNISTLGYGTRRAPYISLLTHRSGHLSMASEFTHMDAHAMARLLLWSWLLTHILKKELISWCSPWTFCCCTMSFSFRASYFFELMGLISDSL